jgi:hypothetical protein
VRTADLVPGVRYRTKSREDFAQRGVVFVGVLKRRRGLDWLVFAVEDSKQQWLPADIPANLIIEPWDDYMARVDADRRRRVLAWAKRDHDKAMQEAFDWGRRQALAEAEAAVDRVTIVAMNRLSELLGEVRHIGLWRVAGALDQLGRPYRSGVALELTVDEADMLADMLAVALDPS